MATCIDPACGLEMTDEVSCLLETCTIDGSAYQRVPYQRGLDDGKGCHDCATPNGGLHHPGCDMERCPVCGHQAISCDHRWSTDG